MKKYFFILLACIGVCGLMLYGYSLYNGTKYEEENGTNINSASKDLEDFYAELEAYYPDFYKKIPRESQSTFVIPGLVQSESIQAKGEDRGDTEQTEDMTPQGLSFLEKYVLISAYSKGGEVNSVIWVLDKESGDYIKTIVLPSTSHVGGMAYDSKNERLWVTTTDEESSAQVSALDLQTIEEDDFVSTNDPVTFDYQFNLDQVERSSYMAYDQEKLLVGYFDKDEHGHLGIYQLDPAGFPADKDEETELYQPLTVVKTPDQVQGIVVYEDQILFSQSYGNKDSKILWFDFTGYDTLTDMSIPKKELVAPPYLQQILVEDQFLYLLFESSSLKYRINPTVTSMDRVVALSLEKLK
ncbi:hypothetical protein [Streptococcus parasuis]|uniref:DUF4767 domain-containing protein n=1 Tax=Streptococcus parasuis TaxID=1501662 RepID=A0ABV2EQ55_9STRE|nr:hypothetical protein [Streptococcus parasuis]BCP59702.1 hypothetical protein SUT286_10280 [Streptococcus parasuis]